MNLISSEIMSQLLLSPPPKKEQASKIGFGEFSQSRRATVGYCAMRRRQGWVKRVGWWGTSRGCHEWKTAEAESFRSKKCPLLRPSALNKTNPPIYPKLNRKGLWASQMLFTAEVPEHTHTHTHTHHTSCMPASSSAPTPDLRGLCSTARPRFIHWLETKFDSIWLGRESCLDTVLGSPIASTPQCCQSLPTAREHLI